MTSTPAAAPTSTQQQKTESRQAGLRQANLAILIVLIVQFALGKLTDGYSIGMALAFAVALACYAIGLFAASARKAVGEAGTPRL